MSTRLAKLATRARKEARLTNVIQFVDEELLLLAFRSLRKQAAPGLDGQRYEDYAADLGPNLRDLHQRLRTGRYRAPVVRRAYIPTVERHLWMTGERRRGPDVKEISAVGDHALAERADGPEVVAEAVARAGIVGRVDDAHDQGALADRKDRPRTLGLRGIAR